MRVLMALCAAAGLAAAAQPQPATPPPTPSVTLPAPLERVLRDYERAWRQGGKALAELFTEDGFVLSPGRPPIRGRAALADHYGGPHGPLALRALAFASDGSVGYIIGAYAAEAGAPDDGKFTLTLRRGADGKWLIASDMDNPNRRPQ